MKNLLLSIIALSVLFATSCGKGGEPTPASPGGGGTTPVSTYTSGIKLDIETIKTSGADVEDLYIYLNGNEYGPLSSLVEFGTIESDSIIHIEIKKEMMNVSPVTKFDFDVKIETINNISRLVLVSDGLQLGSDFDNIVDEYIDNYKEKYDEFYSDAPRDVTFLLVSDGFDSFIRTDEITITNKTFNIKLAY